mmetsp:Transcript_31144/g.101504  ORF Transcript_31144/g.101504 Transcript_31144/m.101504 type:complete len:207 (+) Transcript_31144:345-965(+)
MRSSAMLRNWLARSMYAATSSALGAREHSAIACAALRTRSAKAPSCSSSGRTSSTPSINPSLELSPDMPARSVVIRIHTRKRDNKTFAETTSDADADPDGARNCFVKRALFLQLGLMMTDTELSGLTGAPTLSLSPTTWLASARCTCRPGHLSSVSSIRSVCSARVPTGARTRSIGVTASTASSSIGWLQICRKRQRRMTCRSVPM